MKRLLLFLSVFVSLLLLLALLIGPKKLLQATEDEPAIQATSQDPTSEAGIRIVTGQGAVSLDRIDSLEMPIYAEDERGHPSQELTQLIKVKDAVPTEMGLVITGGATTLEHYEAGRRRVFIHSQSSRIRALTPWVFDLRESSQDPRGERKARARRKADRDPADESGPQFAELDCEGGVVVELLREDQSVALHIETEHLLFAPEEDGTIKSIRAPTPVRILDPSGSLKVEGQGMLIDCKQKSLRIHGPLRMELTEFSMKALLRPSPVEAPAPSTTALAPLVVSSKGDLVFVEETDPSLPSAATRDAFAIDELFQSGIVSFYEQVTAAQGAESLASDLLQIELVKVAASDPSEPSRLDVRRLFAGDGASEVEYRVRGGEGCSRQLLWQRSGLSLAGPVRLDGVALSETSDKLDLKAEQQLTLMPKEKVAEWELSLFEKAALDIESKVKANADKSIRATLREASDSNPKGEVLSFELEEGARLQLSDPESQELLADLRGELIHATQVEGGRWSVVLLSSEDSRPCAVVLAAGEFQGSRIDLCIDPARRDDFTVDVQNLTKAWFDAPAGFSLVPSVGPSKAESAPAREQRLHVRPTTTARFIASLRRFEVHGDCELSLQAVGEDPGKAVPQRLRCEEIVAAIEDGRLCSLRATGKVVLDDPSSGAHIEAEEVWQENAGGWIHLRGKPASATMPLEDSRTARIEGERLDLDPASQQWKAAPDVPEAECAALCTRRDSEALARRALLVLPQQVMQGSLWNLAAAGAGPSEAPSKEGTIELLAMRIESDPKVGQDGSWQGHLDALGWVEAVKADSSRLSGQRLHLDFASKRLRIDGEENLGVEACALQPKPYDPTRVESIAARWMEFRGGGEELSIAPGHRIVLYLEDPWTPGDPVPPMRRVDLRCEGPAELSQRRPDEKNQTLLFQGGVRSVVDWGRKKGQVDRFEIDSRRLEIVVDPASKEAVELHAQQLFRLRHPRFLCEGGTLSLDLRTHWLQLKAGAELCRLTRPENAASRPAVSRFRTLRFNLDTEVLDISPLEVLVEAYGAR